MAGHRVAGRAGARHGRELRRPHRVAPRPHAFLDGEPGAIELVAERTGDDLVVRVRDDGRGLPDGFDPVADDGLGLQIVRTLVTTELGGSLSMTSPPSTGPGDRPGTEVVLTLPGAGVPRR